MPYDPPRIYRPGAARAAAGPGPRRAAGPRPPAGPRYPGPYPPATARGYDTGGYDTGGYDTGGFHTGGYERDSGYERDTGGYDREPGGYERDRGDRYPSVAMYRSRSGSDDDDADYYGGRAVEPDGFLDYDPLRGRRGFRSRGRGTATWLNGRVVLAGVLVLVLLGIVAYSTRGRSTLANQTPQPNPAAAGTRSATTAPADPAAPSASAPADGGTTTGTTADGGGATADPGKYEAEDAQHNTLGPTTELRAVAGASGGMVVTKIGHGTPTGDVRFDGVTAATAGQYTLTVSYILGDTIAHRLALWVNGKGPTILSFKPTGAAGSDTLGTYQTTITLNDGDNTIRFSNATTAYGPDLDCITVEAK